MLNYRKVARRSSRPAQRSSNAQRSPRKGRDVSALFKKCGRATEEKRFALDRVDGQGSETHEIGLKTIEMELLQGQASLVIALLPPCRALSAEHG